MQNKIQLFCFTHAGGTGAFFDEIEKDLVGIELIKLEYAGHGSRYKEDFYSDFDDLADDLFQHLKNRYNGGEYALFGYSMGSISLVEVLKRIIYEGLSKPLKIFLAAHEPHTKYELLDFKTDELDEWVKKRTIEFGAVPEKLLNNNVFWRTYLPIYRADYTLIGKYRFDLLDMKADIQAVVFYSENDTPREDMEEWTRFFPCKFFQFSGTHFFIQEHHKEMSDIIKMIIQEG